mgnify:CR=1 FL=1
MAKTRRNQRSPEHTAPHTGGGGFWAWAGVRLTAGGFMAGSPAS